MGHLRVARPSGSGLRVSLVFVRHQGLGTQSWTRTPKRGLVEVGLKLHASAQIISAPVLPSLVFVFFCFFV